MGVWANSKRPTLIFALVHCDVDGPLDVNSNYSLQHICGWLAVDFVLIYEAISSNFVLPHVSLVKTNII